MTDSQAAIAQHDEESFLHPPDIPDSFKKAVGVVQVAMASLGLLHRKIYNVLLSNAYRDLGEGNREFTITVAQLSEYAEFQSNDYQLIYDHCKDLVETTVEFIDFDAKSGKGKKRKRRRGATSLLAGFSVSEGGVISYSYSRDMAEKLYEPEQYVWMALSAQSRFSSKYELNLFENCIRYIGIGSTGFKDVEDWRALLGAKDETYNQFKRLNTMVIKPAVKGVNDKSGIIVKPEFEREKRRIARVKFSVKENPQASLLDYHTHQQMRKTEAYAEMIALGLKEAEAFYWIGKKGERAVLETVDYVKSRKKIENRTGYFLNAMREGFAEKSKAERNKEDKAKIAAEQRRKAKAEMESKAELQKALEARFQEYRRERAEALMSDRTEVERGELGQSVLGVLPRLPGIRDHWRSIGMDYEKLEGFQLKTIRPFVVDEVLKRWGNPEDNDFEAYKATESESVI